MSMVSERPLAEQVILAGVTWADGTTVELWPQDEAELRTRAAAIGSTPQALGFEWCWHELYEIREERLATPLPEVYPGAITTLSNTDDSPDDPRNRQHTFTIDVPEVPAVDIEVVKYDDYDGERGEWHVEFDVRGDYISDLDSLQRFIDKLQNAVDLCKQMRATR